MTEYMISLRKDDSTEGGVGPVRYLAYDTRTDLRVLGPADWIREIMAGFPQDGTSPEGHPRRTGDILFFVHGFNVDRASALKSQFDISDRLSKAGWKGKVVSYDWPSDGLVFGYLPDRLHARNSANGLITSGIKLLEAAQQTDCTINVHVMAHSMGCFVVQQAFNWAYQDVPPNWNVAQVMLVAGDVDASVFSAGSVTANAFGRYGGRFTAYCNRYDKALTVSNAKRLELAPRLGRVGLPPDAPPTFSEVDCDQLFDKVFPGGGAQLDPGLTHGFYFQRPEFWRDVALTLAGGLDRIAIPTRAPAAPANHFELDPQGITWEAYQKALAQAALTPSTRPDQIAPDA